MRVAPEVSKETRIVKPRKAQPTYRHIVALSNGTALNEQGTVTDEMAVIRGIDKERPTIFATRNGGDFVARVARHWQCHESFNWQATVSERDIVNPQGQRYASRVTTIVQWFGFTGGGRGQKSLRHLVLDPIAFYGRKLDDVYPGQDDVILRLLKWATELRDWAHENNFDVRATNGAMASQVLRDKRFYPNPRRKVPTATNDTVRKQLPGNYYRLYASDYTEREFSAVYLDQEKAHHYHAERIRFPHSDSLTARGQFHLDGCPCSISVDSNFSGLYYLRYSVPNFEAKFRIQDSDKRGETYDGFVYSNELSLYRDAGYKIHGAHAAWGSYRTDPGLNKYAKWSRQELERRGNPQWLKPLLLATYGVLATRPKAVSIAYGKVKTASATPISMFTGKETLTGMLVSALSGRKLEPSFANVLHRGMIEAATRAESLHFARLLHATGFTVLSIYADAVIVEKPDSLPVLPDPWRIETELSHLQFVNKQAFVSGQMTKLPGNVGRDILRVSRGTMGQAPIRQKTRYNAITGDKVIATGEPYRYLAEPAA